MASHRFFNVNLVLILGMFHVLNLCFGARILTSTSVDDEQQSKLLRYHNGSLLQGTISVNLLWYGNFKPSQRAIVSDFIASLSNSAATASKPSVATWWKVIEIYYRLANANNHASPSLILGKQLLDQKYSLGKSLSEEQIVHLASQGEQKNAINVVLTASDVTVVGFCVNRCGTHGSKGSIVKGKYQKFAYIWVGNSETQCPGYCAWPFHQPSYGPKNPPLVAPNNDMGMDGVVAVLSGLLAGTATNPFGNGFYQGPATAPLEAASACPGVYGKGAYPGYPGHLLLDPTTGGSYNAHGASGRKYLLQAIYDPSTSQCSTLV